MLVERLCKLLSNDGAWYPTLIILFYLSVSGLIFTYIDRQYLSHPSKQGMVDYRTMPTFVLTTNEWYMSAGIAQPGAWVKFVE